MTVNKITRILFIDEVPVVGGGGTFLLSVLRALPRDTVVPTLLMPSGPLSEQAAALGIRTIPYDFEHRYESAKLAGLEFPLNPLGLARRLRDALRIKSMIDERGFDVVYTNNLDSHLVGWFLNKIWRIPVIWHIHVSFWPRSFYWPPWVNKLIFCSEWSRKRALGERDGKDRVHVIPNGIDVDALTSGSNSDREEVRAELGVPPGVPLFGTSGRLDPIKRTEVIVRAARMWKDSGRAARWVIIGGEIESRTKLSEEERLRTLIRDLDLEREVILTGFRSDVLRLVSGLDAFLFASVADSNPRSVLEAMALGIPVIAANGGGVPEMVGPHGFLVNGGEANHFVDMIDAFLREPLEAQSRAQAARNRVRERYHIKNIATMIESVCRRAAFGESA